MLKYMYGVDHSVLSKMTFCGYGGETSIEAVEFGLRYAKNMLNKKDPIRWLSPRRWFDERNGKIDGGHRFVDYLSN
jgi:hypothetical protein